MTKNESRIFSPASNVPLSSTFSKPRSGPMLFKGASSHGSSSEFPVLEESAQPASSVPSAQQLRLACSESMEGSPSLLKSNMKLNMVLPSNTVVELRTRLTGSQVLLRDWIWQVSESSFDHPWASSMLTPISTCSNLYLDMASSMADGSRIGASWSSLNTGKS